MTAGLRVLNPGLHTTVQDLGRIGYQALGVPVSGALDSLALQLANALVGNPAGAAALEILGVGPTLQIIADSVRLAVAGAGLVLIHKERALPAWQSVTLFHGEVFRLVLGRESVCAYLAVEGGFSNAPVLGSASTYVRAGLGGFHGRALQRGDEVPLAVDHSAERAEHHLPSPPLAAPDDPIRVVLGPQQQCFTEEALATLLSAEYRVSKHADRMGIRLDGPPLDHRDGWDIVSDAIATGAIQVPGSGRPIVLLADHQTTGGYPKIATVISADLPIVGRRRTGDAIRFAEVSVEQAEQLARDAEKKMSALLATIAPVSTSAVLDLASLYAGNLISGVVTAVE
jgi:allophanate hydrolase